ncbi:MAG TPA: flagellar biosynthesis protein FliQ [Bacillales bacterium]|nr:flagellar biosynthesis protein FliQ [Bacillales bacterium]
MTQEFVISIARQGVYITLLVAAPIMIIALVVGLLVSIFQATTQIQEQTLAFVPKIAAVLISLIVFGPWMLTKMVSFTTDILNHLSQFGG